MPSFQCNSSFSSLGTSAWRLADSMTSCFKHSFPCQDQILGLYRHFFVQKPTSGVPQTLWCMQCGQWVFYAAFFDPLEQARNILVELLLTHCVDVLWYIVCIGAVSQSLQLLNHQAVHVSFTCSNRNGL